jgi:hypothetical protein
MRKQPDGNSGAFFCYARVMVQVEGIPEGWELVRIGCPSKGEFFVDNLGAPFECAVHSQRWSNNYVIIRKVEKPKQYRPFANAEEFKPHRDRWIRFRQCVVLYRITEYSDTGVAIGDEDSREYDAAFASWVFEDGSPFGVEVA